MISLEGFKIVEANTLKSALKMLEKEPVDIPELTKFFVQFYAEKINGMETTISAAFLEKLQQHDWKGNIRELKNAIERAIIVANGAEPDIIHLPLEIRELHSTTNTLSAFALSSIEKLHIQRVLIYTNHNKAEASRLLNIGLATLYRKIEDYQLQ